MFGSIYIGLSGLNAYSRGLQQVSNNVTNMNTSGFKASTVTFQNFFGTEDSGGLAYTVDARGSGGGVGVGTSSLDLKAGELRQTDRDLDLAVDGTGFLVLLNGDETLYARTGSFEVDEDGYVVLAGTEYRLAMLDSSNHPVAVTIDSDRVDAPEKTSSVKFQDTLSTLGTDPVAVSDIKVYDSTGHEYLWKVTFTKDPKPAPGPGEPPVTNPNRWKVTVTEGGRTVGEGSIEFDNGGFVASLTQTISIIDSTATDFTVSLDFSSLRSYSSAGLPKVKSVDGHAAGALQTIAVNAKGELELGYSNGQKQVLGTVALADFRQATDLEQRTAGIFAFDGKGERILTTSADERVGKVLSKRIEASNVDLSKQFGDLILIQRGFQASSQVISISNDMIQQLFGIRGQG